MMIQKNVQFEPDVLLEVYVAVAVVAFFEFFLPLSISVSRAETFHGDPIPFLLNLDFSFLELACLYEGYGRLLNNL